MWNLIEKGIEAFSSNWKRTVVLMGIYLIATILTTIFTGGKIIPLMSMNVAV